MGRTSLSGWPLLFKLRRAGLKTNTFDYTVSIEDYARIRRRLVLKITALAARGDYVLVGHSLGGVLIRAAVNALPAYIRKPGHVFLLGSPIASPAMAKKFGRNPAYRIFSRDCGRLLASTDRMSAVGALAIPTTGIAGVSGIYSKRSPFFGELNDGVVSISEVSSAWLTDQIQIPTIHTLLPCSMRVAEIILTCAVVKGRN